MNNVINVLWDWRFVLSVVLGFVIWAVADIKNFKILVNQAIVIAKSKAKDGVLNSGKEQEDWVVEKVYAVMPARIKLFVSEELLRKIVYKAYHLAKDLLDDGKLNGSVAEDVASDITITPVKIVEAEKSVEAPTEVK